MEDADRTGLKYILKNLSDRPNTVAAVAAANAAGSQSLAEAISSLRVAQSTAAAEYLSDMERQATRLGLDSKNSSVAAALIASRERDAQGLDQALKSIMKAREALDSVKSFGFTHSTGSAFEDALKATGSPNYKDLVADLDMTTGAKRAMELANSGSFGIARSLYADYLKNKAPADDLKSDSDDFDRVLNAVPGPDPSMFEPRPNPLLDVLVRESIRSDDRHVQQLQLSARVADAAEQTALIAARAEASSFASHRTTIWGVIFGFLAFLVSAWPYVQAAILP